MEIKRDEIKENKKLGNLNGGEVRLISLKGGFHIGMGRKSEGSSKSDILAVGSHPALVTHQIEKKFKSKFEQTMAKNEGETVPSVEEYSHNLTSAQKNVLGLDIVAIKKNEEVNFQITKHNFEVFSIKGMESAGEIILEKSEKNEGALVNLNKKELSDNLAKSIKEYADKNGLIVKKKF